MNLPEPEPIAFTADELEALLDALGVEDCYAEVSGAEPCATATEKIRSERAVWEAHVEALG